MPMNVSDIMRRSFATIKPDAPILDAAHLLIETNQRGLPVIDHDGALVGVISEGDFLHRTELDISPPAGNWLEELLGIEEDTPARRRMRARLVREVMTRDPVCVDDEASLDEVVALMDARHIAQLPVVCGGSVVGVVSRVELLAAVARALQPGCRKIVAAAQEPPQSSRRCARFSAGRKACCSRLSFVRSDQWNICELPWSGSAIVADSRLRTSGGKGRSAPRTDVRATFD